WNQLVDDLATLVAAVKAALAAHAGSVRQLTAFLEFDPVARFGVDAGVELEDRPFVEQEERFGRWLERRDDVPALVAFNHLAERCRAEGLGPVVAIAESWPEAGRHLVRVLKRHWFETLLQRSFHERPALSGFDGPGHE